MQHVPACKVGNGQGQRAACRNVRIQRPDGLEVFRLRAENGGVRRAVGFRLRPVGLFFRFRLAGGGLSGGGFRPVPRLENLIRQLLRRIGAVRRDDNGPIDLFQKLLTFRRGAVYRLLDDGGIKARSGDQLHILQKGHIPQDDQRMPGGQGNAVRRICHRAPLVRERDGTLCGHVAGNAVRARDLHDQFRRVPYAEGKRERHGRAVALEDGLADRRVKGHRSNPPLASSQASGSARSSRSLASDCMASGRAARYRLSSSCTLPALFLSRGAQIRQGQPPGHDHAEGVVPAAGFRHVPRVVGLRVRRIGQNDLPFRVMNRHETCPSARRPAPGAA